MFTVLTEHDRILGTYIANSRSHTDYMSTSDDGGGKISCYHNPAKPDC